MSQKKAKKTLLWVVHLSFQHFVSGGSMDIHFVTELLNKVQFTKWPSKASIPPVDSKIWQQHARVDR